MKSRLMSLINIPRWAGITAMLVVLAPSTVFATHFELSRLAAEIELLSDQLADELRYTRHYGSVRQRALTLRREAAQFAESLRRNRSNSRIRSRFKDVRRGYERLEQAFFVADRRDHDPRLYREINLLSNVFTNLSDEFYYAGFGGQSYGPAYNAPYSGIAIIGSRNYGSRSYGSRNSGSRNIGSRRGGSRDYDRRDHDSRSNGRIVPNRERAVPPVFRGNSGGVVSSRQDGRGGQDRGQRAESEGRDRPGRAGLDRGSRSVQNAPSFDHRSNVLERQGRQNNRRRELGNQTRNNRSSVSPRQSSRGTNVQRGRGGRNGVSENRRRN
ncbi:MAG: hypothetical protein COB20_14770 [SAR86 cluster bacterium]|uniref:Uncharacterized protein n=1 Tax=SAR86 cluster bacterium TaxID=2030880 RepID=A0A2A4WXZ2_9GAMM|nr:MAG: hypothetical protein COB20_14770 [SAR86 cluster bacterium]